MGEREWQTHHPLAQIDNVTPVARRRGAYFIVIDLKR